MMFGNWLQNDSEEKLNQTEYTQPVMLSAGIAVWRAYQQLKQIQPTIVAGHSLGEYTALVAADALSFKDALALVQLRGQLMQSGRYQEVKAQWLLFLGLKDSQVLEICKTSAQGDVVEAVNFNSPQQVIVAGHTAAVERAMTLAKEQGAKRALLLPVSVPSHSSLMSQAADELAEALAAVTITTPSIQVVHNVDAKSYESAADIRKVLKSQLHKPVLWVDSVAAIMNSGVNTVIEFGPGKVLAGLCKRIDKNITSCSN